MTGFTDDRDDRLPTQDGESRDAPTGRTGVAALAVLPATALFLLPLILYAALSVVFTVLAVDEDGGLSGLPVSLLLTLIAQPFLFVGLVYLIANRVWGFSWSDFGLRPLSRRWLWRIPLIWIGCLPVIALLKVLTDPLLGTEEADPYGPLIEAVAPSDPLLIVAIVAFGGLVIPFSEEFLFRGFAYGWLRARVGRVVAIGISAILFSLVHLQAAVLVPILFLGVLLAVLREWTGSVWASVYLHALHNSMMFLFVTVLFALGEKIPGV